MLGSADNINSRLNTNHQVPALWGSMRLTSAEWQKGAIEDEIRGYKT